MLAGPKLKSLTDFISSLSKEELVWVNGYLSGIVSVTEKPLAVSEEGASQAVHKKITIAYGTETGNSKKLATEFASKAKKNAVPVKLVSLDQYRLTDLSKEEYFITVISTQGEGEPPIAALKFYEHIHNNGFKVPQLKFGVLALGDTSYPMFCKTGEDVDTQLLKLGGNRIAPLQKCDLDYEDEAHRWFDDVLKSVAVPANQPATVTAVAAVTELKKPAGKTVYTGTILSNINLNATGSKNTTYHIELAAENVNYITGDSIGIVPQNARAVVEEIISLVNTEKSKLITWRNETATLEELLTRKIGVSFLLEKTLKQFAAITGTAVATSRLNLLELLRRQPLTEAQFEELLPSLNPIAPRIYNIASSPATHDGEVHIIVKQDAFTIDERREYGLCTLFLEDKKPGDEVQFFVQTNKRFRLPENDKDIIMIGPGTGIAPFRSFVAERDAVGATGRNWLFFAEDKFTTDFLYQTEWQNWFATGVLTQISLAFNSGLKTPLLVHEKLYEQRAEFFEWIGSGSTLYLCGEKEPMGKEVEDTLVRIFQEEGKMNQEDALKYFEQLKNSGRYVKDLY